jgi:Ca-activated chloride channel homolog
MIYQNEQLFSLFLLLPFLIGVFYIGYLIKKKRRAIFIKKELWSRIIPSLSYTKRGWKKVLILLSLLLIITATLRPKYGTSYEKVFRKSQQIIIALDVSFSMLAQDIKPSRFEHAKHEIQGLIKSFMGNSVGLIAFSKKAHIQCPLTIDYNALTLFLDDMQPGMLPDNGTDLSEAIEISSRRFKNESKNKKILILISDGEFLDGDPIQAAKKAKQDNIAIYTIGIGSPSGEPIPIKDEKGNFALKKDNANNIIISKLNTDSLKQISEITGGRFFLSNNSQLAMDELYKQIYILEKKELEQGAYLRHKDQYQIFLLLAFIFLFFELLIFERKNKGKTKA